MNHLYCRARGISRTRCWFGDRIFDLRVWWGKLMLKLGIDKPNREERRAAAKELRRKKR